MSEVVNDDPLVEAMITKWLEFINLWGEANNEDYQMTRDYITGYRVYRMSGSGMFRLHHDDHDEVVLAELYVTDELGYFQLLGVFEEEQLVYATSCVDTTWGEFFRGEFPTGLIDATKPYERQSEWLNAPDSHKSTQWYRGYDAGRRSVSYDLTRLQP